MQPTARSRKLKRRAWKTWPLGATRNGERPPYSAWFNMDAVEDGNVYFMNIAM
jgi:hypothetical protein